MLNTSETIKDLEVPEGRRLLHDYYHDRRVKHALEIQTLLDCWRMCKRGREVQLSDGRRVRFETHLGFKLGTRIFFEEIVSAYYFNIIQGYVYAGAMLLLLTMGMYLMGFSVWYAFGGLLFEAIFLLLLATVAAYSPNDETRLAHGTSGLQETLLTSMNNTVREMTNAVSDLYRLISQSDIRQDVLLTRLTEHLSRINSENVRSYAETIEESEESFRKTFEQSRSEQLEISRRQLDVLERTRDVMEKLTHTMAVLENRDQGSAQDSLAAGSASARAQAGLSHTGTGE